MLQEEPIRRGEQSKSTAETRIVVEDLSKPKYYICARCALGCDYVIQHSFKEDYLKMGGALIAEYEDETGTTLCALCSLDQKMKMPGTLQQIIGKGESQDVINPAYKKLLREKRMCLLRDAMDHEVNKGIAAVRDMRNRMAHNVDVEVIRNAVQRGVLKIDEDDMEALQYIFAKHPKV